LKASVRRENKKGDTTIQKMIEEAKHTKLRKVKLKMVLGKKRKEKKGVWITGRKSKKGVWITGSQYLHI